MMTCGIYAIVNKVTGKRYVGKSVNIELRWANHLSQLRKEVRSKDTNRHLFSAFKKQGEESFGFEYLEVTELSDEILAERELFWIEQLQATNREFGYNLRKDTSTKCIVSSETRLLISEINKGESNPNFGNKWDDEQKSKASAIAARNHSLGRYSSEETKRKHSESSMRFWKENPDKKEQMKKAVSLARTEYKIAQLTKEGDLITVWETMFDILTANPDYFRIAIYNCINGHKKSYRGFLWRKVV